MSVDVIARGLALQAKATGLPHVRAAQRILRSAARGIAPITSVMATAPSYSEGASGANSSIIASATVANGGGRFNTSNGALFQSNGAFEASQSGTAGMTDRSLTKLNASSAGYRRGAHGAGIVFGTDADQFDVCASWGSTPFILYVTDLRTGIRARTQVNDIVPSVTATSYKKWAFADAAPRIIELYPRYSAASSLPIFRGVNVPESATIWPISFPDEPRVAWIGDSWGDTGGTTNSNAAKLLAPDYLGERLGVRSVLSLSQSGSGLLNDASGQGSYYQRAIEGAAAGDAIGDLHAARIGALDLIVIPGSINDRFESNAAWSDAAAQAAMQALVSAAMAAQPGALIIGLGPQQTRSVTTPQSRYDALKAGFRAAADASGRCLWIDNSPMGEPLLFGSATSGNISIWFDAGDTNHLNDVGQASWGRRVGTAAINALTARFANS